MISIVLNNCLVCVKYIYFGYTLYLQVHVYIITYPDPPGAMVEICKVIFLDKKVNPFFLFW